MLNKEEYAKLIDKASQLTSVEDFNKVVNDREFEEQITKIASSYKIDKELYNFFRE